MSVGILCGALLACTQEHAYQPIVTGGDAQRGRLVLRQFECGVCHVIPGIRGARGRVGPPLDRYARRVYIAGKFPNAPDRLVRWIQDAPSLAPQTAMPALGVNEAQARDMAAYLYSLQ